MYHKTARKLFALEYVLEDTIVYKWSLLLFRPVRASAGRLLLESEWL